MGWVNKDGRKYYRFTKVVGKKINKVGNEVPIRKEFTGKTKKEAEEKYKRFMDDKAKGIESSKQYFGIMADKWINNFFIIDNKLKDSTKRLYLDGWKRIQESKMYSLPLEEVTANTIQTTYNQLNKKGVASSTIKAINKLMRRFYKYLESENYARNVTNSLTIPRDDSSVKSAEMDEITVWSDAEISAILNGFDNAQDGFRFRFLIVLALFTGCRIAELLALTYDDFTDNGLRVNKQLGEIFKTDENGNRTVAIGITEPKSKSSVRTIPLDDYVLKELESYRLWQKRDMLEHGYRSKYLFVTENGTFQDDRNVTRACERYYKRIGVERKKFHTYRHTFGTRLCTNGVPIQVASKLLGHSDINITAKYYLNISDSEKEKAIKKLNIISA